MFSLQRLVLSFNEIKESGANAIAYAVADKPALEKLDLDGRSMVNAGQGFMQDKIIASHTCFGGHMDVTC